jgi:hypothetical protein
MQDQFDFDRDISPEPLKQQKLFDQSIIVNQNAAVNSTMNSSNFVNSFNFGAPANLDQSLFGLNQSSSEPSKPSLKSSQKKTIAEQDFKIKKMKSF